MTIRGLAALAAVLSSAVTRVAVAQPAALDAPAPDAERLDAGGGGPLGAQPDVHLGVHLGVHLSWVRADTAADCPDAATIEAKVAARLGDNPFQRAPTQFIEAIVARQMETFQVTIAMRGADGKLVGNRSLASTAADCRSIATAAALTIAILIDPDALMRPPTTPPAPAPTPAAPSGPRGRMAVLAEGAHGLLPAFSVGVALAATVDLTRRAAIGLSGAFFPESRTAPSANQGFAFGLSAAELIACFVAIDAGTAGAAGLRWELCGGFSAGLLHVVVYAPTPLDPGQRWTFAASQLTRLVIPIYRAGVLEVGAALEEPFARRSFFIEGQPAGMDTVFTQPVLAVKGFVGLGLRWR